MSEANKAVIRRLMDTLNKHDSSIITELYPDCLYHSPVTGELRGEALRNFVTSMLAAFPDCQWTIHDQLAEGDKVVTRWSLTGTHRAKFMDVPATNKRINVTGLSVDRMLNGKIVEEWEEWDTLGIMQQLGVVPAKAAKAGA